MSRSFIFGSFWTLQKSLAYDPDKGQKFFKINLIEISTKKIKLTSWLFAFSNPNYSEVTDKFAILKKILKFSILGLRKLM